MAVSLSLIVFWTSLISDGYKLIDRAEIIYFKVCHNRFRCITASSVFSIYCLQYLGLMVGSYSHIFFWCLWCVKIFYVHTYIHICYVKLFLYWPGHSASHHLITLDYRIILMANIEVAHLFCIDSISTLRSHWSAVRSNNINTAAPPLIRSDDWAARLLYEHYISTIAPQYCMSFSC